MMGMYDTVWTCCPKCEREIDFQTKAGKCELNNYVETSVPLAIAEDLDGVCFVCACGHKVTLVLEHDIKTVKMIVN